MTSDLISWVIDRIVEDDVDDDIGYLALAALDGDEALDQYLSTGAPTREIKPHDGDAAREVGGTFLRSIAVEGFRGVGPKVTIDLAPEPGLTVIAGRNGSGKSSIAEALELVLTGSIYRWKNRTAPWRQHWRNLHHPTAANITVVVAEEGVEKLTTLRVDWSPDATDVDDRSVWTQVHGAPRGTLEDLGWAGPLETFRPMLSYDELGGILVDGQAPLYDALTTVLGVEQLTDALKRVGGRVKELKTPQARLTAERRALQSEAEALDDERARAVARLLKKTAPDVEAIRVVVTGVAPVDSGPIAGLRALSGLAGPAADEVSTAAAALRGAVQQMATAGEGVSRRELDRLELRKRALAVHHTHGDMPCPVCAAAHLDDQWAAASRAFIEKAEADTRGLAIARDELDRARAATRALVTARPRSLDAAPVPEVESETAAARAAWDAWAQIPETDLELADHIELHVDDLVAALGSLRGAASTVATNRDDVWAPLAARVARWIDEYAEVLELKPQLDLLTRTETWLKGIDGRAKNERLTPIVDEAKIAWTKLRQESNVDLVGLELTGSKTTRRVAISATVDGEEASGLPVMSQGELHALALALFLPRAAAAESPFRFLVIDDPVQAMDPAKVDGLVELLAGLAETRQVIVLSHDDRLPAAIRRSRVGARLFEVRRGPNSSVQIVRSEDPATRYLADGFAMIADTELPSETVRRALPGLLRMAVESAARDRYFARGLDSGSSLADLEAEWDGTRKTGTRVSLAVYGDIRPLDDWLAPSYRREGLGVVTSGFHDGLRERADLKGVTRSVERLVDDVRTGAK